MDACTASSDARASRDDEESQFEALRQSARRNCYVYCGSASPALLVMKSDHFTLAAGEAIDAVVQQACKRVKHLNRTHAYFGG